MSGRMKTPQAKTLPPWTLTLLLLWNTWNEPISKWNEKNAASVLFSFSCFGKRTFRGFRYFAEPLGHVRIITQNIIRVTLHWRGPRASWASCCTALMWQSIFCLLESKHIHVLVCPDTGNWALTEWSRLPSQLTGGIVLWPLGVAAVTKALCFLFCSFCHGWFLKPIFTQLIFG